MTITSFLLLTIFPALLPPSNNADNDEEQLEYYDCLGLNKNERDKISITDIRKAYRKKSLQLHPDKIAQKRHHHQRHNRHDDIENEMKKEYEKVQEAYNCLQDEKNRQLYHDYKCNVIRYRFVSGPHPDLYNPIVVGENLAKASVADKTRIVFAISIILLLLLLQPILIATKVNGERLASASWITILIPWFIMHLSYIVILVILVVMTKMDLNIICKLLESILWLIGIVVLAVQWDRNSDGNVTNNATNWNHVAVPFYLVILMRIISSIALIKTMKDMQAKMITMQHLEKIYCRNTNDTTNDTSNNDVENINNNNNATASLEDLPEEKQKEILKKYIVVHEVLDDDAVELIRQAYKNSLSSPNRRNTHLHRNQDDGDDGVTEPIRHNIRLDGNNNDDEDEDDVREAIRIQTSSEYKNCEMRKSVLYKKIGNHVIIDITFVILVSQKLSYSSNLHDTSWWIIFLPLLIPLCLGVLIHCGLGCCFCFFTTSRGNEENEEGTADGEIIFLKESIQSNDNNDAENTKTNDKNNSIGNDEVIEHTSGVETCLTPVETRKDVNVHTNGTETCPTAEETEKDGEEICSEEKAPDNNVNRCILQTESGDEVEANLFAPVDDPSPIKKVSDILVSNNNSLNELNKKKENNDLAPTELEPQEEKDETEDDDDDDDDNDDDNDDNNDDNNNDTSPRLHKSSLDETMGADNDVDDDDDNVDDEEGEANSGVAMCCWYVFQLILLCLIIGKLEASYDVNTNEDDSYDDDGYSAFWILFPFFLFTGIIICCCSWLLYCTKGDEFDRMKQQQQEQSENENNNSNKMNNSANHNDKQDSSSVMIVPPPINVTGTTATPTPTNDVTMTGTISPLNEENNHNNESSTKLSAAADVENGEVERSTHSVVVMDDID